jgi:hypothetical protein
MHIISYRALINLFITASVIMLGSFITGCKDEGNADAIPLIRQLPVDGIIVSDTALPPGGSVVISLDASGGRSNITYFGISMNDGETHFVLDSGLNNPDLHFIQPIFKGNSPEEVWTFTIMNRDRQKSSVTVLLTKALVSQWGHIITYDPVILGAQGNTDTGGFYSLSTGQVRTYQQAEANQANTDLIYYFGTYEATFSSPMESDAPSWFPGLDAWTIRNETRYDTTSLSSSAFSGVTNDSLILVSYEPVNGKRKAKYLLPGMVVSFRNQAGKTGLILVRNVVPGETGKVECAIKVQQ